MWENLGKYFIFWLRKPGGQNDPWDANWGTLTYMTTTSRTSNTHLVNDGLHVGLVGLVPIEQGGPLVGSDAEATLHGDLDNLGVMFAPQCLVCPELLLQLHQGRVLVSLGHLCSRGEREGYIKVPFL